MSETPSDFVTLQEAGTLVPARNGRRVHLSTIYRWLRSGKLRGYRVAGRVFVSRADVLAMLQPFPVQERQPVVRAAPKREQREADRAQREAMEQLKRMGVVK